MSSTVLIFGILTLLIVAYTIVQTGQFLDALRGTIKKERVNTFWTTHDIESGLCTIHATTAKQDDVVIVMNNIIAKFILAKANPQFPLELIYQGETLTALRVKNETFTLENSTLTPISGRFFGLATYSFLALCLISGCGNGGFNSLIFLTVMPLLLYIIDRMTNNLVTEETLHQYQ